MTTKKEIYHHGDTTEAPDFTITLPESLSFTSAGKTGMTGAHVFSVDTAKIVGLESFVIGCVEYTLGKKLADHLTNKSVQKKNNLESQSAATIEYAASRIADIMAGTTGRHNDPVGKEARALAGAALLAATGKARKDFSNTDWRVNLATLIANDPAYLSDAQKIVDGITAIAATVDVSTLKGV